MMPTTIKHDTVAWTFYDYLSPKIIDAILSITCFSICIYQNIATQIWEMGQEKTNTMDFAEAIDNSDLEAFGFTDDFIFELWGAITDAKAGRLRK